MGRKKIEIRPLLDERNRNVTFLKRKAGLMKKAWELSVLCGADVSIMVFSAGGKAYEFSSRDLESEIDRYLEYEGLIERRRAEEFAAMADAGEDDSDDDDDTATRRKGSTSKAGKAAAEDKKAVKTLKGKEVYKVKMPSRREIGMAADQKRRKGDRKPHQGFIEGMVSDSEGDDRERSREGSDLANMNYAMSLGPSTAAAQTLANFPSSLPQSYPQPSTSYFRSNNAQHSPQVKAEMPYSPAAYSQTGALPPMNQPVNYPPNMGGIQWDAALLQRYTEFQMQQNHQRQHRLLLQRQREQLALLGVGIGQEGERRLLDDIFGAGGASGRNVSGGQEGGYQANGQGGGQHGGGSGDDPFIWPTFSHNNASSQPQPMYNQNHNQPHQQQPQHPSRDQPSMPAESSRHPYYHDEFDYDRQAQSLPTPNSSTAAATPWYSGMGDMGGEPNRGDARGQAGGDAPYSSSADFDELITRKRGAEEGANGSESGDKRIRVS